MAASKLVVHYIRGLRRLIWIGKKGSYFSLTLKMMVVIQVLFEAAIIIVFEHGNILQSRTSQRPTSIGQHHH